jgi:exopolyphosphatase/guanosine-5'-triphosphate,3'-diphosphate pyrophosphatase
MSVPSPNPGRADAAVIDVGSNSVRLVLYRLDGRAVWTIFNEKVLAGLGRGLVDTGRLSPEGVRDALTALRRFQAIIEGRRPPQVFIAATAAVRESVDGPAFCRQVAEETGLALRVLSGVEEARYAALGVLAGAPRTEGLVADLGGASLELTRLTHGCPGEGVTLPLGPFSLGAFEPAKARAVAQKHLKPIAERFKANTLTAVGGSWRNIALLHMRMSDYPLNIIHQYTLSRREALEVARFTSQQSRSSLERIDGISKRRAEGLPHAAVILEALIEVLGLETIVLSAFGVREGLLFESMAPAVRAQDPLPAGCAALGSRPALAEALGVALETWLAPAFEALDPIFGDRDAALLGAACRLAEFGDQLHPDHRPELVFDQVLRASIAGLTHAERAFLAVAAFARHNSSPATPEPDTVTRLIPPEAVQRARALGAGVRLGCELSGRTADLLVHGRLEITPQAVILQAEAGWEGVLLGEQTLKRANALAGILERDLQVRTLPAPARTRRPSPAPAL